jgi:hypothetical protein
VAYLALGRMDNHFVRIFGCCTQPGNVISPKDAHPYPYPHPYPHPYPYPYPYRPYTPTLPLPRTR